MCAGTLLLRKYIEFPQKGNEMGKKATWWYIADIKHGVVVYLVLAASRYTQEKGIMRREMFANISLPKHIHS